MSQPISGRVRTRDGCELFYRLHSQSGKPNVVFIHSLAIDSTMWDGVVAELGLDAGILVYDCRGHGRSERRPGAYTTELFANDLADVLDYCGWSRAFVAGCSMGGCVAQAFAAAYPDRTQGLALIDTTSWYGPGAREQWRQRAASAAETGFAKMLPLQLGRWFSEAFCGANPGGVEAISRVFLEGDLACYQSSCTLLGSADLRGALKTFRAPVAVMIGERDQSTPLEMSQAIQASVPQATLDVIPGCGHLAPIENPRKTSALLKQLISRGERMRIDSLKVNG